MDKRMNNLGKYTLITFEEKENYENSFVEFLENHFEVVVCNYTSAGLEQYVVYENIGFDEDAFINFAKSQNIELLPYKIEIMENKDWLRDNVIRFEPIEIEDFLVYGIHEKNEPKTDKIPIKIYAATAFGSEHQTTQSCLKAISRLNKIDAKKDKILDVGTGSGILSIACAKLWGKNTKIFAVDIDIEAVNVTRQNAIDNNVDDIVSVELSTGYASDFVKDNSPYDIIIANILARPLIDMAKDLEKSLNKGGYCILSGFVEEQVDWVVKAHEEQGLRLVEIYEFENWRAVLMEK